MQNQGKFCVVLSLAWLMATTSCYVLAQNAPPSVTRPVAIVMPPLVRYEKLENDTALHIGDYGGILMRRMIIRRTAEILINKGFDNRIAATDSVFWAQHPSLVRQSSLLFRSQPPDSLIQQMKKLVDSTMLATTEGMPICLVFVRMIVKVGNRGDIGVLDWSHNHNTRFSAIAFDIRTGKRLLDKHLQIEKLADDPFSEKMNIAFNSLFSTFKIQ